MSQWEKLVIQGDTDYLDRDGVTVDRKERIQCPPRDYLEPTPTLIYRKNKKTWCLEVNQRGESTVDRFNDAF